jgi:16S rRNA processing protein RimM
VTTTDSPDSFVEIGRIGRPHGLGGELRLVLHNPSSSLIFSLSEIRLKRPGTEDSETVSIQGCRAGNGCVLLFLGGVGNRDEAEFWKESRVYVQRKQLPPAKEGEFYVADLPGVDVYDGEQYLGKVISSCDRGGVEVIDVLLDNREIQIPLVPLYLERMNLGDKVIHVINTADLPVHHIRCRR